VQKCYILLAIDQNKNPESQSLKHQKYVLNS